jgi:hypothetical protein
MGRAECGAVLVRDANRAMHVHVCRESRDENAAYVTRVPMIRAAGVFLPSAESAS